MKFRKPMAAKNFEGNEHRVEYPCFVQPKLDGVRCVTDGQRFWSRNGKRFPDKNLEHLKLPKRLNVLVDGELMVPGALFEESISALKHASDDDRGASRKLRFHVFDVVNEDPFRDRLMMSLHVMKRAQLTGAKWLAVPTLSVRNRKALEAFSKRMLKHGHEGAMVRNAFGLYESKRSYSILKLKPLLDAEYPVVGVKEGKGKDKGTPIFICSVSRHRSGTEQLFRVRPKGTMKQRRAMWRDRKKCIGKKLTVEFQNLTKYGVPRFPRAKVFRDYE